MVAVLLRGLADIELSDLDLHEVNVRVHVGDGVPQISQLGLHGAQPGNEVTACLELAIAQKLTEIAYLIGKCIVHLRLFRPYAIKLSYFGLVLD